MVRIRGEIRIDAPIEEVFDLVADERNEPRYNPRIVHAEKLTDGPVAAGARFTALPKGTGARGRMRLEILEYDRPHRLRNDIRSSAMRVDGTLTFRGTGTGTLLGWDWDMTLVGPVRILTSVLALVGPGWERRNWEDPKKYMEARGR